MTEKKRKAWRGPEKCRAQAKAQTGQSSYSFLLLHTRTKGKFTGSGQSFGLDPKRVYCQPSFSFLCRIKKIELVSFSYRLDFILKLVHFLGVEFRGEFCGVFAGRGEPGLCRCVCGFML